MRENGFTLVEIIAVLIILAIIVLVAFPNILSSITKTNEKMDDATKELLITNAKSYWSDNNLLVDEAGSTECVTVKKLVEENYTKTPIATAKSGESETIIDSWTVKATRVSSSKWTYEVSTAGC